MEVVLREHTYHEGPSPGSAVTCSLDTWGAVGSAKGNIFFGVKLHQLESLCASLLRFWWN